jgi:hypothetical protein
MSGTRERLKAAIIDLNIQSCQVERARRAVELAQKAVEDARAELESHGDLDKRITGHRVQATKRGANPKILPADLAFQVDARKAAESEVSQAESTLEVLEGEWKEIRKTLKPLEQARVNAACAVLVEEQGDDLAREYIQASARARDLFLLLGGLLLTEIEVDGKKYSAGGTQAMATAAVLGRNDGTLLRQMFPEGADVFADMGGRWKARIDALMMDSEAAISRPKPIAPLDYARTNPEAITTGMGMRLPAEYKVRPEE